MSPIAVIAVLLGLPLVVIAGVALRIRSKEKARDAYLVQVDAGLIAAGAEPLGRAHYRVEERVVKAEAGTNPLFSPLFSVRLAAYSDTIHDLELRRGTPIPPEFEGFRPLLERWDSAGKMFTECYAAGVTAEAALAPDLRILARLAGRPLEKPFRGGTFTIREGFERDVPAWHWRPDQRARLPKEARRWCVSCWHGDPYLNPRILQLFDALAGTSRKFFITDQQDLAGVEHAFGPVIRRAGNLCEFDHPSAARAADLHLDGEFFGGLLVADDLPPGFEDARRFQFHDRAIKILPRVRFYARRLFDDEFSWYSGEYEIVSVHALDVRGEMAKRAAGLGAQVLELDRRFNKRILVGHSPITFTSTRLRRRPSNSP